MVFPDKAERKRWRDGIREIAITVAPMSVCSQQCIRNQLHWTPKRRLEGQMRPAAETPWQSLPTRDRTRNALSQEQVVIKSVLNHPRVRHERDILRRFQGRTPYLRPILDEIQDPADTIVLKYLDDDLQSASNRQKLSPRELRYVSKKVLQALSVLHEDGFVHTDVKLDNILVNYGHANPAIRFTDVQLADCGATYHVDSEVAKSCTTLIALIYGDNFHILRPPRGITVDHDDYDFHIMVQQFKLFGPLPDKFDELLQGNENNIMMAEWLVGNVPKEEWSLFSRVSETELPSRDRDFICRIMRMDPRDRPTANELLNDPWFDDDSTQN
ncbi:hypothetical protein BLS_008279 [Venturia inaequalis]|uniref:Protein kinase domain-containing protein n=1 Tax=Venturia inaequalis TaxID=5025 RepID=A0A8H3YLV9_VENIN|nr:hypothetical protein BLS_008279 [Venturia inaequalis]